jgi:hypothetical protein
MERMLWEVNRIPEWPGIINNSIFTFFPSRTNMELLEYAIENFKSYETSARESLANTIRLYLHID